MDLDVNAGRTVADTPRSREKPSRTDHASSGLSYAILSQPRTGSTLLMELLHVRGMGNPDEYLNGDRIEVWWPKLTGSDDAFDLQRYMTLLRHSQSGPAGHFGIKIHYGHLGAHLADRAGVRNFVGGFDKIIVLSRVNKLAQAVSALKAEQTRRWGAAAPEANVEPSFDPVAIAENIRRFLFQDRQIARLKLEADRPVLFVTYEELRDSMAGTWERIQGFLGVTPEPVPTTIRTRPQRDALSHEFEDRFLKLIQGAPAGD
jgi:LPS sulfotransferase NodH